MKNQYRGGECLKNRGLGLFADLRGGLTRKGVVFLRGGFDTPRHTTVVMLIVNVCEKNNR